MASLHWHIYTKYVFVFWDVHLESQIYNYTYAKIKIYSQFPILRVFFCQTGFVILRGVPFVRLLNSKTIIQANRYWYTSYTPVKWSLVLALGRYWIKEFSIQTHYELFSYCLRSKHVHACHRRHSTMIWRTQCKKGQSHLKVAALNAHNCLLAVLSHVESIMQNDMLSSGIHQQDMTLWPYIFLVCFRRATQVDGLRVAQEAARQRKKSTQDFQRRASKP